MPVPKHKDSNPKDLVGSRKWGQMSSIPWLAVIEQSDGNYEGNAKYGRHNYRVKGVLASVYFDAMMRHLLQWWEGEDIDEDSGKHHLSKVLSCVAVLRDAMIADNWVDDRPPRSDLEGVRRESQKAVDKVIEENPEFVEPYTEENKDTRWNK